MLQAMIEILGGICFVVVGLCSFLTGDAPALVIIICIVLFVLPGLWLIYIGLDEMNYKARTKQEKTDREKMPPVDVTAAEILSNRVRATSLYRDRKLRVTGTITDITRENHITSENGLEFVGIIYLKGTGTEDSTLYCKFSWYGSVESVSIGQKVTIEGIFRNGYMEKCNIKSTNASLPNYFPSYPDSSQNHPKPAKKSSPNDKVSPIDITAEEILSDTIKSSSLYDGKRLRVTGTITKKSEVQLILNGNNGLVCKFALPIMIKSVSIGQSVTIGGVFRNGCMEQCYI